MYLFEDRRFVFLRRSLEIFVSWRNIREVYDRGRSRKALVTRHCPAANMRCERIALMMVIRSHLFESRYSFPVVAVVHIVVYDNNLSEKSIYFSRSIFLIHTRSYRNEKNTIHLVHRCVIYFAFIFTANLLCSWWPTCFPRIYVNIWKLFQIKKIIIIECLEYLEILRLWIPD